MSRWAGRTVDPATPELSPAEGWGHAAIPGTGPASQPPTLATPRDEGPSGSKDWVQPWGWLQKAGAVPQAPGRSRGGAPEPRTAGPGRPGPGERPASVLIHGAGTRGRSTPQPAVRLPGLPAGALEGRLGAPMEDTGGAWGGGGRPDRSGPGSSAHGVCSCLGGQEARADVPPHGDGTHIPRSSSSQASSRSQWVVPPATRSLEIHPMACGRPSQASWKQWGQEGVCAEPCSWSPRGSLCSPCCCW